MDRYDNIPEGYCIGRKILNLPPPPLPQTPQAEFGGGGTCGDIHFLPRHYLSEISQSEIGTTKDNLSERRSYLKKIMIMLMLVIIALSITSCNTKNQIQVGDIITFGVHEWRVLDINDGKALIISEYIIEERAYHRSHENITWAKCSLREYLNNTFYHSDAFNDEERSKIVQTMNITEDNQWHGTGGGDPIYDRIFLLSLAEVVKYFGDSGQLAKRPSDDMYRIEDDYNTNRIAYLKSGEPVWWWLRSPGDDSHDASYVGYDGAIYLYGNYLTSSSGGVRPALWMNLDL